MQVLPIDELIPNLLNSLQQHPTLVLEAPPGAGKTTRVPYALLEQCPRGSVLVSEPRRLAARLAARRVASERETALGGRVGYRVRFDDRTSQDTRLFYVSDGVLLRELLQNPRLEGIAAIVLDEFHERHLVSDLSLALLRRLQLGPRPDLRVVVMSATLDAEPVAAYLGQCPRLRSEGRAYPVALEYLDRPDERPLASQIASAVRRAFEAGTEGDLLIFVPGAAEIRAALGALERLSQEFHFLPLPLHGELPLEQQARAVEPAAQRKVVVSTNVAESSITIPGVNCVIDAGLARVVVCSPYTGLPRRVTHKISRAAAAQRAGRAGRTGPGRVLRLYTQGDHDRRLAQEIPEILRTDLSETLLWLQGSGITAVDQLTWLDAPPVRATLAGERLLALLGALAPQRSLTPLGRDLLRLPLHPRLGRLLVEGENQGIAGLTCLAAALLGERDLRLGQRSSTQGRPREAWGFKDRGNSDLALLIELFENARAARFAPAELRSLGVDVGTARAIDRARAQLLRTRRCPSSEPVTHLTDSEEDALGRCLLAAFPDRVARRRQPGSLDLILASGEFGRLSPDSCVHDASYIVAFDVEERAPGSDTGVLVRLAAAIEPDWILDLFPEQIETSEVLSFNADLGRVETLQRMSLGSVVLDETRGVARPSAATSELLAREVLKRGRLEQDFERLCVRLTLISEAYPGPDMHSPSEEMLLSLVSDACQGAVSLKELGSLSLADRVQAALPAGTQHLLRQELPERMQLPGGRSVEIHYEAGKPPWIASRLQDFFGLRELPRLGGGRWPVTAQLLAPNQRAVQITSDLAGFWRTHYPDIRRELMRRYPRHAWPMDGATAVPPPPAQHRKSSRP